MCHMGKVVFFEIFAHRTTRRMRLTPRRTRPRCGASGRRGGGAAAPVKALVAGLTAVANAVAGVDARAAEREAQRLSEEDTREPISPQQVLEGVRADFVDNR